MQTKRSAAVLAVISVLAVQRAHGQAIAARVVTRADRDLLTALVAVEDSRDTLLIEGDTRSHGLSSKNPFIRAFTVRGLGRLERAAMIPTIATTIDDASSEVRSAAADALAQSAVHGAAVSARSYLTSMLQNERDAAVRGMILESIGRLPQASAAEVAATAQLIAPSLSAFAAVQRRGAMRGLFILSRRPEARPAGAFPSDVADAVFTRLMAATRETTAGDDRVNLAGLLVNVGAMTGDRTRQAFGSFDPYVRDRAVAALQRERDTALVRSIVLRALDDSAPIVRYRAIGMFARRLRDQDGCTPLERRAIDRDVTVALAAIDALSGCRGSAAAATSGILDSLAAALKEGDHWHASAHALVSLTTLDAARARARFVAFELSRNMFVRMYADSAARLLRDTAALYRLAKDREPNVRTGAIHGLSALVGRAADSVYVAALKSDDNQLLMAATAALKGSPTPDVDVALNAALQRLRGERPYRQTAFDGIKALEGALAARSTPAVASTAGVPSRNQTPTFDDLADIERLEATIEMADGAVIRLRLSPFDAPTNTARFVRLAKDHAFDGLTFHRVAPFFVVQGPSPDANEYSAPDGPFTRDELGDENVRGSIGLSTRGRDTADGQIFINTVDNTWLDHEYTVMGRVTAGLTAFDAMQEGARIKRVTVKRRD